LACIEKWVARKAIHEITRTQTRLVRAFRGSFLLEKMNETQLRK
jgi:hypothetical protein